MIVAAVVVLLNGILIPAVPPAELIAGRVMVPVMPVITRFVERVSVDEFGAIRIEARGHRCTLRVGVAEAACDDRLRPLELAPYRRDGVVFIPLGDVARAFGGEVTYDAASGTAAVSLAPDRRLETPAPFDPGAPQVAPSAVFTPQPASPTPRPTEGANPRPRRTAIPVPP